MLQDHLRAVHQPQTAKYAQIPPLPNEGKHGASTRKKKKKKKTKKKKRKKKKCGEDKIIIFKIYFASGY